MASATGAGTGHQAGGGGGFRQLATHLGAFGENRPHRKPVEPRNRRPWYQSAQDSKPREAISAARLCGQGACRANVRSIPCRTVAYMSNEEIERRRRSAAMLTPGQDAGWKREQVMEILEELQRCRCRGRRLLAALREVRATTDRALRSLVAPPKA